ncbi:YhgE/Pip domain-containing protein [Nocardiopsis composta]|uniref:Putative membrane protein n=1 Tax=Nocardiopsis composta TaxID=157465 RepID=A0A7W8QMX7_9ACTN|nr:YhgE/Pip domain-containing protein [Nocardiopsis composta]MBB5432765.1 putative membrane protein [Nocardiopsis composta]
MPASPPRMLPAPRLGWLSVRSFLRHPLLVAALVVLAVVPLLYTGMYLWAFWDPFGKVHNLPVALVNEDRPATADGRRVHAGKELTERLVDRGDLDWRVTDAEDAAAGVADGRYYASITVPADFSADLVSPADTGHDPTPAMLQVHFNDATNYIATELLTMGFREIEQAVGQTAIAEYLDTLFVGFNEIHGRTEEAAEGAGRLADGAASAEDGAGELDDGLGDAEDGAGELAGGLGDAEEGAGRLADGAGTAQDGASQLADGAASAEDGSGDLLDGLESAESGASDLESGLDELHDGSVTLASGAGAASAKVDEKTEELNALADEWIPLLQEHSPDIESAATAVADGADVLADALEGLPVLTEEEAEVLSGLRDRLAAHLAAHPELEEQDPALYLLLCDAEWAVGLAVDLHAFTTEHRDDIDAVAADARTVADLAGELADAAPDLADDAEDARDQINELNDGLKDLAEGSRELRDGLESAHDGAQDLDDGLGRLVGGADELHDGLGDLRDGADELDSGLGSLSSGADELGSGLGELSGGAGRLSEGIAALHVGAGELDSGLGDLADGSDELAEGLDDGADEIPVFDRDSRDARGDMMSSPARLSTTHDNEVPDYGTGFAPFFLALSLWVGAMVVYMVLPGVPDRGLASTAPSWRLALSGWLPALVLGTAQGFVMVAALHLLLGLQSVNWPGLLGFLALTAAAYTAIVHWVDARFGAPGKVIVLVLLIVQITSAGGTYPLQTSPAFFQAIAPYTPMYWVVSAIRHLLSGGSGAVVLHACLVLAAYTAGALLLSWSTTAGRRTWTMSRLHPVLKI